MLKKTIENLTPESFREFGGFADMLAPSTEKLGVPPIEFYRDMITQTFGSSTIASYSICRVEPREWIVDVSEYHNQTAEMALPLDGDTIMHFAPATAPGVDFPADKVRVFRVPKGTMVVLKPGTWHHAPFCAGETPVNVLIALPERTYANDCFVANLPPEFRIAIQS